jgi:hypothetical protein
LLYWTSNKPAGGDDARQGGRADPVAQLAATEEIKKKYSQYFGI